MLFPYICDCYAMSQIIKDHKQMNQPNRKPKEQVCQFTFNSNYQFVRTMCPLTMEMEINNPGSSSLTFRQYGENGSGPLPVTENESFPQSVLEEYVFREIYHSCILDKEQNGPFCFIYNVVNHILTVMDAVTETDLTLAIKQKIYNFLNSVIPETTMATGRWVPSKHISKSVKNKKNRETVSAKTKREESTLRDDVPNLLQYPNSHLIYGRRWLSIILGFLTVKQKLNSQQYQDSQKLQALLSDSDYFTIPEVCGDLEDSSGVSTTTTPTNTEDARKKSKTKRNFKEYRAGRATALSSVNRVHNSFSTRFQSWWSTVDRKLNNTTVMLRVLADSLSEVFGFTSSFRPSFSLNTNYRFETNMPVLSRDILEAMSGVSNEKENGTNCDSRLNAICTGHESYLNYCYNSTTCVDAMKILFQGCGIDAVIPAIQPHNEDRTGKRQALSKARKTENAESSMACMSLLKKFKLDETLALNQCVFGDHITVEEIEVEEKTSDSDSSSSIEQEQQLTPLNENNGNLPPTDTSDQKLPIFQIDCEQQTTTAMLTDETDTTNYLEDQGDFICGQSLIAMEMIQEKPANFSNHFNLLLNEMGL